MIDISHRALYNSLRMNWLHDPSLEIEPWQVENYRDMSLPLLFSRLKQHSIDLDKDSFVALADEYETPEELVEDLIEDEDAAGQDQLYLLVFELWRRLETDKPCLSVFCDELDHQIYLYDNGQSKSVEELQDVLANLKVILDENTDQGADPHEVIHSINEGCANDINAFLYDFISEQIDNENISYASELLDSFLMYVDDIEWFEFLHARVLMATDPEAGEELIQQLTHQALKNHDLEFNLELLSQMVQEGDEKLFIKLARASAPLLKTEADFQDLATIGADYFGCLDDDDKENALNELLKKRSKIGIATSFRQNDPDLATFLTIVK